MIKVLVETTNGEEIEYTNGAHLFLMHYKVTYLLKGNSILVKQPKGGVVVLSDGDEVTKDPLIALQKIAGKYNAVINLYAHGLTIEFLPESPL